MLALVLFVRFLAVPIIEIYVILQVGGLIGTWPTVGLLVADSVLGTWIVRREGLRAWRTLRETLLAGGMPQRALADAALVLVGGSLLVTPGFVTDALGFLFVLPVTRPVMRSLLTAYAKRRLARRITTYTTHGGPRGSSQGDSPGDSGRRAEESPSGTSPGNFGGRRVIRGDVIDEDPRG